MKRQTRVRLRNKLVKTINNWQQLGAIAWPGISPGHRSSFRGGNDKTQGYWRMVGGTSKDGKTIMIYPIISRWEAMPLAVCQMMVELESRGALVGCAANIGDAWCIVSNDEKEYKRAKRTWYHHDWLEKHSRRKNGSREEE